MSFLKKLFEKKKDLKYGKGHRLCDDTSSQKQEVPSSKNSEQAAYSMVRPQTSEASRKAGEAALARLQNKNNQTAKPVYFKSQTSSEIEKHNQQEKELNKALQLKEHYFGPQNSLLIDAPSNICNQIRFKASILGPDESYIKSEIEDKIEQTLLVQIDEEPILVSVSLLFTANYKNQEKLNKCIEILNKFIDNILNSPNDEKYRKIRVENPIFKEKVYSCKYSDLVLKKSGFKPTVIKKFEPSKDTDIEIEIEEDYFVFEGDNFEKLQALKEALSLGEPIIPQLDRDIKVFKISSNSSVQKFDTLSEDFYNFNIEDLLKEKNRRNEALEKQGMLRTKAMREKDEQLELRRYNYSLIRVRFPNDYILQAVFKTNEKFEDFYKMVQDCIEFDSVPFELFGHSLKKETNFSSTIAESGMAPTAVLNFKWNDYSIEEAAQQNINLNKNFLKQELILKATLLE